MYKKIMVPVDGSELAECVFPHVDALAKGCGVSEIVFVRVAEPSFIPGGAYSDGGGEITEPQMEELRDQELARAKREARDYLERIPARVSYPGVTVRQEVIEGRVAEALTDYAEQNGVDLIVISTHGRSGVSRWVRGSVADRLLRATCLPVLMVRAPGCFPGI